MAATARQIIISPGQRACINCRHYAPCWREIDVPGETWKKMTPVSFGWCTHREEQRGALRQPCRDYETKEKTK